MSNLPGGSTVGRPKLGKYELIAILGHGGMADVYLAVARGPAGFNKLVVVKRLRPELASEPDLRAMFHNEASLAARLGHPNCVTTFEVGEDRTAIFIAMEFLDGQPLNTLTSAALRAKRPLARQVCARIVADALAGLHYAHELRDYDGTPLNIVHRDVSPHNIFITYEGQVKLVDFGIAKAQSSAVQTETGVLKGKVAYMAPEQALGTPVDRRADVFAMGIVLWELLAHRKLMARDSAASTLQRLLAEEVVPPSRHARGIDRALEDVVMKSLARDAAHRYQTANEMRQALDAYLRPFGPTEDLLIGEMRLLFADRREQLKGEIQRCLQSQPATTDEIAALSTVGRLSEGFDATPSHQGLSPSRSDVRSNPRYLKGTTGPGEGPETRVAPLATPQAQRPPGVLNSMALLVTALAIVGVVAMFFVRRAQHGDVAQPAGGADGHPAAGTSFDTILRLHGSNTIGADLGPALAEAFLKQRGATEVARRPGTKPDEGAVVASLAGKLQGIAIEAHGSGTAFEDLGTGKCEIGMASRPIKADEAEALKALGDLRLPGSEHVLGLDGIAVVVHPNNPLRSLDLAHLHDVFTGRVTNWSALANPPGAIDVYARDDRSGTFDVFKHLVLGGDPLVATANRFEDNARLSAAVAGDAGAIGFAGFRTTGSAKAIAVSDQGSTPLYPSTFTVATEDYVLTRRLYLYTPTSPKNPLVTDFVNFALSPAGQQVVKATGFVDLTVSLRDAAPCGDRCPPRYAALTKRARRLSLNFRFQAGRADLDSRASRDLDRVLDFLKQYPNPRVLLLGFSDKGSDPAQALALSKERAHVVEQELTARGVHAAVVDGFGQEMPVASNASDAGRDKNRRVEVWLDKGD